MCALKDICPAAALSRFCPETFSFYMYAGGQGWKHCWAPHTDERERSGARKYTSWRKRPSAEMRDPIASHRRARSWSMDMPYRRFWSSTERRCAARRARSQSKTMSDAESRKLYSRINHMCSIHRQSHFNATHTQMTCKEFFCANRRIQLTVKSINIVDLTRMTMSEVKFLTLPGYLYFD